MPPTPPATDRSTPRVLLFGHPGSGKSSLLGALLQAAETQRGRLGFDLPDPPRTLELLRDHIYHDTDFENTGTELVRYVVRLRPGPANPDPGAIPDVIEILDCDGSAAKSLLIHPDAITERRVSGTVAAAVVAADLLVLVVNAGLDDDGLSAAFDDFLMFLERVHGRKAFGREVGGFPVFVVLSQCDRLAKRADAPAEWEARVRGNRAYVLKRFAEFLDEHAPATFDDSPYLPFGGVEVEGYAVAVRRPELLADPDPANEPFGVAELFRDAVAAAVAHRARARTSDRRLAVTVWAVCLAVAGLVGGGVAVSVFQPAPADPGLADRVRGFELHEAPAAVRLAEVNIGRHKRALVAFRAEPGFSALPEDLRIFVEGRLREIDDYQAYRARLEAVPAPAEVRALDALDRTAAALATDLALPAEYTWADTEAARLRDKWLADVPLIRAAEADWTEWYRGLVNRGTTLTVTRAFDGDWRERVGTLGAAAGRPPFDPAAVVPASEVVPQPRGAAVTYRVPFEFDRVYQARRDWNFTRTRLLHLRDLAAALGLTADPGDPGRDDLVVPPPGPGVDSAALPGILLAALARGYPRPSALYPRLEGTNAPDIGPPEYPEWALADIPEPARSALAARGRESFANGVRHARGLILARLDPLPASDARAETVKALAALDTAPLRDWGRLLTILARLENPRAANPVTELAAFFKTEQFDIELKGLDIAIPLALRVPPLVPTGPVTITLTPRTGGDVATRTFKPGGESVQRGLVMVHRFGPDAAFVYRPGDGLRADVPVRSGDLRFTLTWDDGGWRAYQFDRLTREPRLVRANALPEPATGVTLTPAAGSNLPAVPVLLPEAKR